MVGLELLYDLRNVPREILEMKSFKYHERIEFPLVGIDPIENHFCR